MAGFLEYLMNPATQGMLNLSAGLLQAGGPSRMPVSFGQALGQGMQQGTQGVQQAQQMQMQQQMFGMKQAEAQRQAIERAQAEEAQARFAAQFPQFADLARLNPKLATERAFPEAKGPLIATPGSMVLDRNDPSKVLNQVPVKPEMTPLARLIAERDALPADDPKRKLYDDAINKNTTQQPLVTVAPDNLGLKPKDRFDMEDKLRGDFQANPTVKAAAEMQSAFKLIETASKSPSPANDMAMATKYMKLLDPGSVVRESELAMAMNTTGLVDKVQNYAKMIVTGQKLTPTQRQEFLDSAKAINDAFQKEKDGISVRFSENAKQYNLSPENVVGAPRTVDAPKIKRYNPKTGKIE
jgi:hypothetical protein